MGQGAEDAGGYEIDYDPAYEGLRHGEPRWANETPVSKMTTQHVKNALRTARSLAGNCSFSCDDDKWEDWAEILDRELASRSQRNQAKSKLPRVQETRVKTPVRGSKQQMKCHCGAVYAARTADLKRGWAKSCSKRCASIRREYGRPAATKIE